MTVSLPCTLLLPLICLSCVACSSTPTVSDGMIRCPVVRDTGLSSVEKEQDFNLGASKTIKLKIYQETGLFDFDVSQLKGHQLLEAWLYVKAANKGKWGINGGTDLHRISLSTVGHTWEEGGSSGYQVDSDGHGATFRESSYQKASWGWPDATVFEVSLGNSHTMRRETVFEPWHDWHRIRVPTELVNAMVAGATHGLLVVDGSTDYSVNCEIYSREAKNHAPFLEVKLGDPDNAAPSPISDLHLEPSFDGAGLNTGALRLSFSVPADTFSYDVTLNGHQVDRWQLPFAAPAGTPQSIRIVDLPPDSLANVEIFAVDAAGNRSLPTLATGNTGSEIKIPPPPEVRFVPVGGKPPLLKGATVFVLPELMSVHPVTGEIQHEAVLTDFRQKNAVWDAGSKLIRLAAARGEIVSFQLALEGKVSDVQIQLSDLEGPSSIAASHARLWRNWYLDDQLAWALPLNSNVSCPMPDNKIRGQTLQTVTVDYHIPLEKNPGRYTGQLTLATQGATLTLNLVVVVYAATIPETIFFNPELNCYGGPGKVGSGLSRRSHSLAHYHRCSINRVPYSQNGKLDEDYRPETTADGRITSWKEFDQGFAGLLDGSWFRDNPRSHVPVPTLYLPHFEGYPLNFRDSYHPGENVPMKTGKAIELTHHHLLAKPVVNAMDSDYGRIFIENLAAFRAHFDSKGWTKTLFQVYLNNKGTFGGSHVFWTLDEPYKTVDWDALLYWGRLVKTAAADPDLWDRAWHRSYFEAGGLASLERKRSTVLFRGDISRITEQGSLADGVLSMVYGDASVRTLKEMRERMPAILYTYGSTSPIKANRWKDVAWCVRAYTRYADGVLPWQSLGGNKSFFEGDEPGYGNALIVDSGKAGFGDAIASLRVHALRRGAQLCELLRLLQLQRGWTREHIAAFVNQYVQLESAHRVDESAKEVSFQPVATADFVALEEGILRLLEQNP